MNRLFLAGVVALSAILVSCGEASYSGPLSASHQRPTVTPTPVGVETPSGNSIYFGAYVSNGNGGAGALEVQIGRTLAMDMHYKNWISEMITADEYDDLALGRLPVESWNCGTADVNVAGGYNDQLLTTVAQDIRRFGHAVFFRFMWDPNMPDSYQNRQACWGSDTDNPDGTFSAAEYVNAWRHVRHIFFENGVTNVVWVWSFNAAGSDPTAYYPGSNEVDWVAIDAYDPTGASFSSTFSSAYTTATQFNKPILIAETGAPSADQSSFFTGAAATLQSQFPMIKGFMYFDGADFSGNQWSINSSAVPAFTTFALDPYVSAFGSV